MDLAVLTQRQLDVLVTLEVNTTKSRDALADVRAIKGRTSAVDAYNLERVLAFDMGILAEAFELFAPQRKFQMEGGEEPTLVTTLLRREAG